MCKFCNGEMNIGSKIFVHEKSCISNAAQLQAKVSPKDQLS